MTPIYFPNTAGLIPRFTAQPSSNDTLSKGLLAGAQALTSVADNYRELKRTQDQGNAMADALDKEGLHDEANLYRAQVKSASVNYFQDPETNKKLNQGVLSDALSLLKGKQERDLKEKENEAMLEFRKAQLDEQKSVAKAREESSKAMALDRDSRNQVNAAKVLDGQADDLDKQAQSMLDNAATSDMPESSIQGLTARVNQLREKASQTRAESRSLLMKSTGQDFKVDSSFVPITPDSIQTATRKRQAENSEIDKVKQEVTASLKPGEELTYFAGSPKGGFSYAIKGRTNKVTRYTLDPNGRRTQVDESAGPETPGAATPSGIKDPAFNPNSLNNKFDL